MIYFKSFPASSLLQKDRPENPSSYLSPYVQRTVYVKSPILKKTDIKYFKSKRSDCSSNLNQSIRPSNGLVCC